MLKRKSLVASLALLLGLQALAEPEWQTAASAEYKLLWKRLTYTELQVDPRQAGPEQNDILAPAYAKRIVIQYGVGVSAKRFREMTLESLEEAFSEEELAPHRQQIERFCSWFVEVDKDDQYSLSWWPDGGLWLSLNGRQLGQVEDAGAAAVILSVWLGRAAISEDQRDEMLQQWRAYLAQR